MTYRILNTNRPVVIHGIGDARAVCRAAVGYGHNATIWSARGASAHMGPLWFLELSYQINMEFPELTLQAVLDCGAAPGDALAAIRSGVKAIALTANSSVENKIQQIAAEENVALFRHVPKTLNLTFSSSPEDDCRIWFGIS
ncbi:MAG: hypothetical protein CMM44_07880 [Rhodospirillaceae bacterium]|nr:hypothetical protein [Rhodospirillaceae bacterium]